LYQRGKLGGFCAREEPGGRWVNKYCIRIKWGIFDRHLFRKRKKMVPLHPDGTTSFARRMPETDLAGGELLTDF